MIIRVEKRASYVAIDKTCIEDTRLSFKAKGLHTYLMSRPDNWKPMIEQLKTVSSDGREAVRTGMKELENYGYIVRKPIRDRTKIVGWEHIVYENPQSACSEQESDFQMLDNQMLGNRTLINNDLISNDLNKSTSSPTGDYTDEFLSFWEKYPRKVGKQQAFKSWKSIEDNTRVIEALDNYLADKQDTDKKHIKHPTTFLNNHKDFLEDSSFPLFRDNYKNLFGKYNQHIEKDALDLIERGLDEQMLLLSMAVAKKTGKTVTWPYLKAICERWLKEGIKTFADYQHKEGQYVRRPNGEKSFSVHNR